MEVQTAIKDRLKDFANRRVTPELISEVKEACSRVIHELLLSGVIKPFNQVIVDINNEIETRELNYRLEYLERYEPERYDEIARIRTRLAVMSKEEEDREPTTMQVDIKHRMSFLKFGSNL